MNDFLCIAVLVGFLVGCSSSDGGASRGHGTGGGGASSGGSGGGGGFAVDGAVVADGGSKCDADCNSSADAGPTCSPIAPDLTLADRQEKALARVSSAFTPLRKYDGNCVIFGNDGWGLVARLELGKRKLPGGATSAEAGPWIEHVAKSLLGYMGTGGVAATCPFSKAGSPSPAEAASGLAYAIIRYDDGSWPSSVKESVRALVEDGAWDQPSAYYLANGWIDQIAADLLVGEALGRTTLFQRGADHLSQAFERVMEHGEIEGNSTLYTNEHFPALAFLQILKDPTNRTKARILLDYELTLEAHVYLAGGAFAPPRSRDYGGGVRGFDTAMRSQAWLLTGDPNNDVDIDKAYGPVVVAATDYVLPEVIRSIFLDKGNGYSFWAYTDVTMGSSRAPNAVYQLGLEGAQGSPWQTIVLPGGVGASGLAYGWANQPLGVDSGTYARAPDGSFAILYQSQPWVGGDTDELLNSLGSGKGGSGVNNEPDDFLSELYDYERMAYGHTTVALWDPTLKLHPTGAIRHNPNTDVHLPNWSAMGGESTTAGNWRVGRLGDTYVAYLPLGSIAVEDATRDNGTWTFIKLANASGGITELATTKEFPTLAAYAENLAARAVKFNADPLWVEVEARDPETGKNSLIRLEYRPERRLIDGVEQSVTAALDHGLMHSPFVNWDPATRVLEVSRDCYAKQRYDWSALTIQGGQP